MLSFAKIVNDQGMIVVFVKMVFYLPKLNAILTKTVNSCQSLQTLGSLDVPVQCAAIVLY